MHEPNGLPSSGSGLLWDFLSLQMLLLIQVGPMSNTITLWPSSIMCREAFIFRSSFGVTLALRKEAEGQDSQWPCFFFLQMCSSPGQESQGSLAVTYYSRPCTRLPHPQPPLTPCCSGAASISHHHFQTHHVLISVLPDPRAVVSSMFPRIHQFSKMEAWSPRAAALCVCQCSPRPSGFS